MKPHEIFTKKIIINNEQLLGGASVLTIGHKKRKLGYGYVIEHQIDEPDQVELGRTYDVVAWWKVDIPRATFISCLSKIMNKTNIAFVVSTQLSHITAKELEVLGFDVYTCSKGILGVYFKQKYREKEVCKKYDDDAPNIVAVCQCFNAEDFLWDCIESAQPYFDTMLITDSCNYPHSPHARSIDDTATIAQDLDNLYRNVHFVPLPDVRQMVKKRVEGQGKSKELALRWAEDFQLIQDYDIVWILDHDEVYDKESLKHVIDFLKTKSKKYNAFNITEMQYTYGVHKAFISMHGRGFRWMNGATCEHVHSFTWPDKTSPWDGPVYTFHSDKAIMHHLSYVKSPEEVREKVLSFGGRKHFERWYNKVYLEYAINPVQAYLNNKTAEKFPANGFTVGSNNRLFDVPEECLPEVLKKYRDINWIPYIQKNYKKLLIPGE